ncbi:hypothetical protein EJ377_02770 [Chryseobacterium arthrosphaerae]|uniref:Uncharacterized protein n=1 Tax=Chryseobacterium arthrosphaerae TaxID=651561 RepID=A0A432DYX0_9FLAO|nr:hypothetical protein EJ377_02770 [Chryseobacterium arthrosphaerae]
MALKQIEFASLAYTQSKWGNVPSSMVLPMPTSAAVGQQHERNDGRPVYGKEVYGRLYTSVNISWEADIWERSEEERAGTGRLLKPRKRQRR